MGFFIYLRSFAVVFPDFPQHSLWLDGCHLNIVGDLEVTGSVGIPTAFLGASEITPGVGFVAAPVQTVL